MEKHKNTIHTLIPISDIAVKYLRQIEKYLKTYMVTKDAEVLHKTRIQLKKLRNLLQFTIQYTGTKNWKSFKKKINVLFAAAGAYRDFELYMQKLTEKSILNADDFPDLKSIQKRKRKKFEKESKVFLKKSKKWRLHIKDQKQTCTEGELLEFINSHESHVRLLQAINEPAAYWHEARKKIKAIIYALEWLPADTTYIVPDSIRNLQKLEQVLGDWQNDIVFLELMQKIKIGDKNFIQDTIQNAINTVEKDRNEKEKQIIKLWQ